MNDKKCKMCDVVLSKLNAKKYNGYYNSYCKKCDAKKETIKYTIFRKHALNEKQTKNML